jgi:hypothetical protein
MKIDLKKSGGDFSSVNTFPAKLKTGVLDLSVYFRSLFLVMFTRSESILDHITDYLRFLSNAPLFWFMLNMTMAVTLAHDSVWSRMTMRCY